MPCHVTGSSALTTLLARRRAERKAAMKEKAAKVREGGQPSF
jgi:hypothetical protein